MKKLVKQAFLLIFEEVSTSRFVHAEGPHLLTNEGIVLYLKDFAV